MEFVNVLKIQFHSHHIFVSAIRHLISIAETSTAKVEAVLSSALSFS